MLPMPPPKSEETLIRDEDLRENIQLLVAHYREIQILEREEFDNAWSNIYGHMARPLLWYFKQRVGAVEKAHDCVQSLFLLMHQKLKDLKEPRAAAGWIYQLARTTLSRQTRRFDPLDPARSESLSLPDDDGEEFENVRVELRTDSNEATRVGIKWDVEKILSKLCDRCEEILRLRYFDRWSREDIANYFETDNLDLVSLWLNRCKARALKAAKKLGMEGL